MKILGTGLRGLVGSRIVELLKDKYEFEYSDVDITDRDKILQKIKDSYSQVVLHLAAKTDVDICERDKKNAWEVNVEGTRNVAQACERNKKKLIYISTDFVFDGKNSPNEGYSENDIPNPINWYGKTKYEGEKIVQSLSTSWIIARISYPYRANFEKLDFFRAILKRLQASEQVMGVTDHKFSPTFIDDISTAVHELIKQKEVGVFNVVGSQSLTPFEAAVAIAKVFGLDQKLIQKTTRSEFFKNRAPRPFILRLKNDKITRLGVKMRGFEEGIRYIKDQILNIKDKT